MGHKSLNRIQLSWCVHVLWSFNNLGFFGSRWAGQVGGVSSVSLDEFRNVQR